MRRIRVKQSFARHLIRYQMAGGAASQSPVWAAAPGHYSMAGHAGWAGVLQKITVTSDVRRSSTDLSSCQPPTARNGTDTTLDDPMPSSTKAIQCSEHFTIVTDREVACN
jgi:hypothetical protein